MQTKTILILFVFFVFSIVFSGCLILPIPHTRTHAPEVSGVVIFENTQKPVPNAVVEDVSYDIQTLTDSEGRFVLPAVKGWHGAYCVSPISQSLFPGLDISPWHRSLRIKYGANRTVDFIAEGKKEAVVTIPMPNVVQ